jgi:hypothetical protein
VRSASRGDIRSEAMPFQPRAARPRFVALGRWLTIATRIALRSVARVGPAVGTGAVTDR